MKKTAPAWFSHGAIYQINPRTFSSDGTIKAVEKELPFIAALGFETVYLCPIFSEDDSKDESCWSDRQKKSKTGNPKNPYRIKNYFTVDEEYGTTEDLKSFVLRAHELKMHALLDLVYMHIAPNADILKTHPEFARHDEKGRIIASLYHFPYLNFDCPGLREYLYSNMVYLLTEIGCDGFRCDASDETPLDFWTEGKKRIQRIKPDAVLIHEGSKTEYLKTFDAMYGFSYHESLYKILDGTGTVEEFKNDFNSVFEKVPKGTFIVRDMDNHDTVTDWPERVEKLAGHDGTEMLIALNYFISGIPMVYCGNELADSKRLSMFANRFCKGKFEFTDRSKKNTEAALRRQEKIWELNDIRRKSDALALGGFSWLKTGENVLGFVRKGENENIKFICAFSDCTVKLPKTAEILIQNNFDGAQLHKYGYIAWREKKCISTTETI